MQLNQIKLLPILKTGVWGGNLILQDGQRIIGKIIGSAPDGVLLQLAGKTVPARLEGTSLKTGTLVLLRVALAETGRVEFKVLARWTGLQLPPLITSAFYKAGLTVPPATINAVWEDLQNFIGKYQLCPPPQIWVFLFQQQLPFTTQTFLLSWLYQDRELRSYLWNKLYNSTVVKDNPELFPKVIVPANSSPSAAALTGKRLENDFPGSELPSDSFNITEAKQLIALLKQSVNLNQAGTAATAAGTELVVPFLVATAANHIEEYSLHWREKAASTGHPEPETQLRLLVPTENLGVVDMTMLISKNKVRIGFKVTSQVVRDYLSEHLGELQAILGDNTRITVSVSAVANQIESRFDLWV
ncbi:MAG TPA: hypothetical protein VIM29_09675 [Bacillota bacterium]